jgi:cytochrome b561
MHDMAAPARYGDIAIMLHWTIVVLITANVLLALTAGYFPDSMVRIVIDLHKSLGITVLALAIIRLIWRVGHKPPPLPQTYPEWEKLSAHAAHIALYVLIFALPISGWLHDSAWKDAPTHPMKLFWLVPFPRIAWIANIEPVQKEHLHTVLFAVHTWLGYALYAVVGLHIAGALKHQFLDREPELQRMLPGR